MTTQAKDTVIAAFSQVLVDVAAARANVATFPHLAGQVVLIPECGGLALNAAPAGGYRLGGLFSASVVAFPDHAKADAQAMADRWNKALTPSQVGAGCVLTVTLAADAWTTAEEAAREMLAYFDKPQA